MKRLIFACVLIAFALSGCSGWTIEPLPYISPSPFPSSTPIILSATPIILPPPFTSTAITVTPKATQTAGTSTPSLTVTPGPTGTMTGTLTITPMPVTRTPSNTATPFTAVNTEILSCNTSIDVTHGMGEVTNAYVTIQNTGNTDLSDVCATLNALDEGRNHPDKTKCAASLPVGYQVTEKLTVDSTLGQSTPIQVDVLSGSTLLQRVAQNACTSFDLLPPNTSGLGTVTPMPTP